MVSGLKKQLDVTLKSYFHIGLCHKQTIVFQGLYFFTQEIVNRGGEDIGGKISQYGLHVVLFLAIFRGNLNG